MLMQAAKTQLTPRIALIKLESDLHTAGAVYQPDVHSLQRGTPDLEELLGKEFTQSSRMPEMELPNFLGEGDLLKFVHGAATEQSEQYKMGPAPAEGAKARRVKTPKIRKVKPAKSMAELEGLHDDDAREEKAEPELAAMAKGLMQEESQGLSMSVPIPAEDLRVMKEVSSPNKPPAPLNENLALRLEAIWEALEMPMIEKLGMVVKYSELQNAVLLEESIRAWEEATHAVMQREDAIKTLASIKRLGVHKGKAEDEAVGMKLSAELKEQAVREHLVKLTEMASTWVERLLRTFGDVLTIRGMPYAEDISAGIDAGLERVSGVSIKEAKAEKKG